jgi:hypothetical protein
MNILLIQREGIDLHHTLFASETSRTVLRFYHPKRKPCGVLITCASLASGLSMVSELRWYMRRYAREALFEVSDGVFCTQPLAQDVYYERTATLGSIWPFRRLYGFRDGKLISTVIMSPGSTIEEYHQEYGGIDRSIEVWCTEDELGEKLEPEPENATDGAEEMDE